MVKATKKVTSIILALVMFLQMSPIGVLAELIEEGSFKPAIEMDSAIPKEKMTQEEMQNIYEGFKSKIEKDLVTQKSQIETNQLKEKQILIENQKDNLQTNVVIPIQ